MSEGQRVLLVEDLTTDGGSKLSFVDAIRETGATCAHTAVIFYYGIFPETTQRLADHGVALASPLHLVGRLGRSAGAKGLRRQNLVRGGGVLERSPRLAGRAHQVRGRRARTKVQGASRPQAGLCQSRFPRGVFPKAQMLWG